MSPEEIELWKYGIDNICKAWIIGAIAIGVGIGSISIKNIFGKSEK